MSLGKISRIVLKDCMNLKPEEQCLIITDSALKNIGNILYITSRTIAEKSSIILTPIPKAHGIEPSREIAEEMMKYDVILMPTTKSLSHTRARENATKSGARIASMPGITTGMMKRALNVDFYKIRRTNNKLISVLRNKTKIKIITKKGTNIEFLVKGRRWLGDDGLYTKKGSFGNLPSGEIFIAPLEGKTNGTIIADASVGGLGKTGKNIKIGIKNGFIGSIEGGNIVNQFKKLLLNRLYKSVAELGIGTNYKAKITGNVLEDEKVMGTFHVAFGNNKHFGGRVDVPFHVDFVIRNPTIYADKVLLMKEGKLNI